LGKIMRDLWQGQKRISYIYEMDSFGFGEVVHPAHILVDDPAGDFQLVGKPAQSFFISGYLRFEYFEGDLFFYLLIVGLVDFAHASCSQLFDQVVALGKGGSSFKRFLRSFKSLCGRIRDFFYGLERCSTLLAELGARGIIRLAFGAFHSIKLFVLSILDIIIDFLAKPGASSHPQLQQYQDQRLPRVRGIFRSSL
jgi:hypothetical protein